MDSASHEIVAQPSVTAESLSVKVFADGADRDGIRELALNPRIAGFTTNPTLMHKAGIVDYERFARDVVELVGDRPISFEVFSDEPDEMERQARRIRSWGDNIYVKIPVTNTRGERTDPLLRRLVGEGVKVNVTGLMTISQVERVAGAVAGDTPTNISVFAGRVADTGIDPVPLMTRSVELMAELAPASELIWASPRELLNVVQADEVGCHIITVTHDLLRKLPILGRDHDRYSLETVQMFHADALSAGFSL